MSNLFRPILQPVLRPLTVAILDWINASFDPQNLFAANEPGYLYDLNDSFAEKTAYRRNLLTYTDEWTPFATTNSTKSVTSGVLFFTETAVNNVHELSNLFGIVSGTTYTYQVKAKADLRGCINLGNSGYMLAKFNLRTGAVNFTSGGNPSFSSIAASISNAGDGYYQCTVTATCASTQPAANWRIGLADNDSDATGSQPTYLGVVGYGVYLKDIQVEIGSTATSYQRVTDWNTELLAAFPQTTVFLDSAGTTPASVNGLVGLVLDKSKGATLGSELIPNPTWDGGFTTNEARQTPTGWTDYTPLNVAVSSVLPNSYQFTATAHLAGIEINLGYTGKWIQYKIRARKTAFVSGTPSLQIYSGAWHEIVPSSAVVGEWYEKTVTALTTLNQTIISNFNGSASWEVSSISVKELPGNHAYQATTGNKPVLRGSPIGANLVTNGDFASGTGWTVGAGWAITGGQLVATAATGIVSRTVTLTGGNVYRLTVGSNTAALQLRFVGGTGQSITFASGTPSVTYFTYTAGAGNTFEIVANGTTSGVVDNIEIVDVSAGQVQAPYALQFDGVDDFLQTASVNFTATDKMTVCHGVRKLSDAAYGAVAELSVSSDAVTTGWSVFGANASGYYLQTGTTPNRTFGIVSGGTPAPVTNVITALFDRAQTDATEARLRTNGGNAVNAPTVEGTSAVGNFGDHAIYFGRRGGVSLPFNGLMFSAICVGKAVSATELANIERWTNQRTGAY